MMFISQLSKDTRGQEQEYKDYKSNDPFLDNSKAVHKVNNRDRNIHVTPVITLSTLMFNPAYHEHPQVHFYTEFPWNRSTPKVQVMLTLNEVSMLGILKDGQYQPTHLENINNMNYQEFGSGHSRQVPPMDQQYYQTHSLR